MGSAMTAQKTTATSSPESKGKASATPAEGGSPGDRCDTHGSRLGLESPPVIPSPRNAAPERPARPHRACPLGPDAPHQPRVPRPPPHTGAARQPRTLRCPPSPGLDPSALTVPQQVLDLVEPARRAADLVRGGDAESVRLPARGPHHTRRPFPGDSGTDRSRDLRWAGLLWLRLLGRGRWNGRCRASQLPSVPTLFKRGGVFACLFGLGLDVLFCLRQCQEAQAGVKLTT